MGGGGRSRASDSGFNCFQRTENNGGGGGVDDGLGATGVVGDRQRGKDGNVYCMTQGFALQQTNYLGHTSTRSPQNPNEKKKQQK